ncbi:hypothetical protein FCH79_27085, partial [Pseudomonas koreensis]|nr:hypothetical protein [Pseudomonas koreensis]
QIKNLPRGRQLLQRVDPATTLVGASLLAKAYCQPAHAATDPPHSRAGSLPQVSSSARETKH